MGPLRLAVITAHTSPLDPPGGAKAGGLNVYVLELARELARRGCQVDIFIRATSPDQPLITAIDECLRAIHIPAGPVAPLGPQEIYPYIDDFVAGIAEFARGESGAYDLIHSHYWLSGLAGERLKVLWDAPHVTMFHTMGEIKNRASQDENEPPLRIEGEAQVVRGVDRIICATENEKALIVSLYGADPGKIVVVPLGVDLEHFRPLNKDAARAELGFHDERIILFVGRIEPLKGVDILINAAAMLESDVDCSVLIVGGDEASASRIVELQDLARGLGIDHRVAFVGAVDRETLPLFYNAADVCVVPSHYESFGLVAVEAMACGVPVVASRVGGLTGTVKDGETGYLVPWLCPEPFAERIEMLLANDSLRERLGESARLAVSRFRWESVAENILDVYYALAGGPAGTLQPTGT